MFNDVGYINGMHQSFILCVLFSVTYCALISTDHVVALDIRLKSFMQLSKSDMESALMEVRLTAVSVASLSVSYLVHIHF